MQISKQTKTSGAILLAIVFSSFVLPYLISSDDWILFISGVILVVVGLVNIGFYIFEKVSEKNV